MNDNFLMYYQDLNDDSNYEDRKLVLNNWIETIVSSLELKGKLMSNMEFVKTTSPNELVAKVYNSVSCSINEVIIINVSNVNTLKINDDIKNQIYLSHINVVASLPNLKKVILNALDLLRQNYIDVQHVSSFLQKNDNNTVDVVVMVKLLDVSEFTQYNIFAKHNKYNSNIHRLVVNHAPKNLYDWSLVYTSLNYIYDNRIKLINVNCLERGGSVLKQNISIDFLQYFLKMKEYVYLVGLPRSIITANNNDPVEKVFFDDSNIFELSLKFQGLKLFAISLGSTVLDQQTKLNLLTTIFGCEVSYNIWNNYYLNAKYTIFLSSNSMNGDFSTNAHRTLISIHNIFDLSKGKQLKLLIGLKTQFAQKKNIVHYPVLKLETLYQIDNNILNVTGIELFSDSKIITVVNCVTGGVYTKFKTKNLKLSLKALVGYEKITGHGSGKFVSVIDSIVSYLFLPNAKLFGNIKVISTNSFVQSTSNINLVNMIMSFGTNVIIMKDNFFVNRLAFKIGIEKQLQHDMKSLCMMFTINISG